MLGERQEFSLNLLCSNHFPAGEREGGVQGAPSQPQQTPKGGSGAEQLCLTHGPGGAGGKTSVCSKQLHFSLPLPSLKSFFIHPSIRLLKKTT